jgi:hypothetical protein
MKIWLNVDLDIDKCYNIPVHEQTKLLKIVKENKKNDMQLKNKLANEVAPQIKTGLEIEPTILKV